MLLLYAKAPKTSNQPPRRTSNRHRKQGKGRMNQQRNTVQDNQARQSDEAIDKS